MRDPTEHIPVVGAIRVFKTVTQLLVIAALQVERHPKQSGVGVVVAVLSLRSHHKRSGISRSRMLEVIMQIQ